ATIEGIRAASFCRGGRRPDLPQPPQSSFDPIARMPGHRRGRAMSARVFFYVQHLLGIGHLRRAAVLARTLVAGGFDVLLVSGGAPVSLDIGRARWHQLPPVRARDEGLRELSRLDGVPLDEAFRTARVRELLGLLAAQVPQVLSTA